METSETLARTVVCDAGPIIHLEEVGCLDLLADFNEVLVPAAVWEEVLRHRPAALESPLTVLQRVEMDAALPADLAELAQIFGLHLGEVQALHVAVERQGQLMLTDDTAARLAARQLGILVHGTLGVLLRSIRRGQRNVDQVLGTLRSLPTASTLHLKQSLLEEIVQSVEQRR